jgi:hypothetical protein
MRIERDDGRRRARVESGFEHRPVPSMDAVERAERDGARLALELGGVAGNLHASRG